MSSGRQRLFATALGIRGVENIDEDLLSKKIDRVLSNKQDKANKTQHQIAKNWGIELREKDTVRIASDKLWTLGLYRAYVLSVFRKITESKWKFHSECPLPDLYLVEISCHLYDSFGETIKEVDNSMSGTMGDPWFRFGKKQIESPMFQFVKEYEIPDNVIRKIEKAIQSTSSKSTSTSQRNSRQGCMLILLLFPVLCTLIWRSFGF